MDLKRTLCTKSSTETSTDFVPAATSIVTPFPPHRHQTMDPPQFRVRLGQMPCEIITRVLLFVLLNARICLDSVSAFQDFK